MTGLPIPVVMESDRTPGMSSMVSPSEAPWVRRRAVPSRMAVGWATRRASVATADAVTGHGALRASQLTQHLLPRLAPQALLVTDANAAYRSFASRHGIAHEAIHSRAGERLRQAGPGAIHIQNVNAYHARLKGWLMRFRGVASRYLSNYLGWRWALDGDRIDTVEQLLRVAISVIHR